MAETSIMDVVARICRLPLDLKIRGTVSVTFAGPFLSRNSSTNPGTERHRSHSL